MRRMHIAARDHQWSELDLLDQQRSKMLDDVSRSFDAADSQSRSALAEIIELDQEVINEIHRGMDLAALMTDTPESAFQPI